MSRHRHDPAKNLVGFLVGDVEYAVPITRVKEIANPLAIAALPHPPLSVVGVADYRGEVVAVVDLRTRFGLAPAPQSRRTKWIVVDVSGHHLAFVVDAVTDVFGTGGADLRPAPALGSGNEARGVAGVANHGKALVFVLDTARFRDIVEPLASAGKIGPTVPPRALPSGAER
jgi:purine-binding chemotaxis protein CheW